MRHVVGLFEKIRRHSRLKSHHLETLFAFSVLALTALISRKGWIEWVGVLGVTFTFEYQVLSTYLREHSEAATKAGRRYRNQTIMKEIQVLYYFKEIIWVTYFLFLGAYSALVGTVLFITYGVWRRHYRKYVPINDDDIV